MRYLYKLIRLTKIEQKYKHDLTVSMLGKDPEQLDSQKFFFSSSHTTLTGMQNNVATLEKLTASYKYKHIPRILSRNPNSSIVIQEK